MRRSSAARCARTIASQTSSRSARRRRIASQTSGLNQCNDRTKSTSQFSRMSARRTCASSCRKIMRNSRSSSSCRSPSGTSRRGRRKPHSAGVPRAGVVQISTARLTPIAFLHSSRSEFTRSSRTADCTPIPRENLLCRHPAMSKLTAQPDNQRIAATVLKSIGRAARSSNRAR